jgi:hypothetical protein
LTAGAAAVGESAASGSRLLPSGRITLRDDRLITTDLDGAKTETAVGEDWQRLLADGPLRVPRGLYPEHPEVARINP